VDTTYQGLRTHYAQLSDDDLRHLAVTATELMEDAQRALKDELAARGITDTATYKRELESRAGAHEEYLQQRRDKVEKWHRVRLRLSLILLAVACCIGIWRLIIDGDKTNGIGIILACVIVFPIILLHTYLRRAFWRFLLRKR
jgi:hypothetical protein